MSGFPRMAVLISLGLMCGRVPHLYSQETKAPAVKAPAAKGPTPYMLKRAAFKTQLLKKGPSPQPFEKEAVPEGVKEILYPSGDLKLKAWVYVPPKLTKKAPALVYFHGGFAFGADDMQVCQPFMDAGFVVMCPMLRGENGNPGNFELFYGEVDDAKAAAQYASKLPFVDQKRVFAMGHSIGGMISSLLSLLDDVPIQHCASTGGLYGPETYIEGREIVPFNLKNLEEIRMRLLLGNIKDMRRLHLGFLGKEDPVAANADKFTAESGKTGRLKVIILPGDHHTSLNRAMAAYLKACQVEPKAAPATPGQPAKKADPAAKDEPSEKSKKDE